MSTEVMRVDSTALSTEQQRFMPVLSMEMAVQRRDVIIQAVNKLMVEKTDYGVIPGGKNQKTLWQPGADKLNNIFGLVPTFEMVEKIEDWTGKDHGGEPFFFYHFRCKLFRSDFLMGDGEGSCNSWESKYRYRKSERVCPQCGVAAIIKGKSDYGGGWLCFGKKDGCGAKFKDGDEAIEAQETGRVPNPDVADVVNTIMKMARKRAKVAATINATSAHEFFTQDLEEQTGEDRGFDPMDERPVEPKRQAPQPRARAAAVPAAKQFDMKGALNQFASIKERIGPAYYRILGNHGVEHANEIKTAEKMREIYREMQQAERDSQVIDAEMVGDPQ